MNDTTFRHYLAILRFKAKKQINPLSPLFQKKKKKTPL